MYAKVAKLLANILGVDVEDISPNMTLSEANHIMPIDVAKLVIECEDAFLIDIQDEDVHEWQFLGDVVRYIDNVQKAN